MAYREIPEGSIEIQTGLWLYTYSKVIGGVNKTYRQLFSSECYCFYNHTLDFYDEEGNVIPEEDVLPTQRIYMTFASLGIYDSPDNYTSVPVDPSYEIVSLPKEEVVA